MARNTPVHEWTRPHAIFASRLAHWISRAHRACCLRKEIFGAPGNANSRPADPVSSNNRTLALWSRNRAEIDRDGYRYPGQRNGRAHVFDDVVLWRDTIADIDSRDAKFHDIAFLQRNGNADVRTDYEPSHRKLLVYCDSGIGNRFDDSGHGEPVTQRCLAHNFPTNNRPTATFTGKRMRFATGCAQMEALRLLPKQIAIICMYRLPARGRIEQSSCASSSIWKTPSA